MSLWSKVANPAFRKWNTLNFVQIVNFCPYFIKTNKFNHDLFCFLQTVKISIGIILYFMNFLFLDFLFNCGLFRSWFSLSLLWFLGLGLILRLFFVDFLLKKFKFFINVSGMVHFFRFEISFEKGSFEAISKFDLFILDHWPLERRAFKVLETFDCTVMLSSASIFPFDTDPDFSIFLCSIMFELTYIPNDSNAVVEKNSSGNKRLDIVTLKVKFFKSFALGFKIVVFLFLGFGLLWLRLWDNWNVFGLGCIFEGLEFSGKGLRLLNWGLHQNCIRRRWYWMDFLKIKLDNLNL